MLILSVLAIGYLSLLNMQQGFREYRRLSQEIMPVVAALDELRFSGLRMISSVSELGLIARLEGVAAEEKAAAMVEEVRAFNEGLEAFNSTLVAYRKLAPYVHPGDGPEIERVFHEGNRLKHQARGLMEAIHGRAEAKELFELKEALERTEYQFLEQVSQRLTHQSREVEVRKAVISSALERQFWVMALGSLFLVGVALLQRWRGKRICRACSDGSRSGPEGQGPQISSP